jgi:hypothetical protein
VFLSIARAYFVFIDFTNKEVICLEVSTYIYIVFLDPNTTLNVIAENSPEIPLATTY